MLVVMQRRGDVAILALPAQARRGGISISHLAATMLLTAAIFVLPATADRHLARAAISTPGVTISHLQSDRDAAMRAKSILPHGDMNAAKAKSR